MSMFYQAPFDPKPVPEHADWHYDRLNTFNSRNRKFSFYSHQYVYALLDVLNQNNCESD